MRLESEPRGRGQVSCDGDQYAWYAWCSWSSLVFLGLPWSFLSGTSYTLYMMAPTHNHSVSSGNYRCTDRGVLLTWLGGCWAYQELCMRQEWWTTGSSVRTFVASRGMQVAQRNGSKPLVTRGDRKIGLKGTVRLES
ncbi:hypothetical protein BJX68DRAFT_142546 [Aspergillus pseudodeflectus]|uniref:Uncharacterized protein n=1 Tax=Aspergillus pseudodeflectus TaxID=176178 RepID=A0ABR4L3A0_9EURO